MAVTLHVSTNDRSVETIKSSKQGGRAVALTIMGHSAAAPLFEWQTRLGLVARLDLAFLINGQDNGMGWRRYIEADDIMKLLGKGFVIRQFEATPTMRRKPMLMPDLDQ